MKTQLQSTRIMLLASLMLVLTAGVRAEFVAEGTKAFFTAVQPSGSGTDEAPYVIASLDNLLWIAESADRWGATYNQTADIDATSTSTWNAGAGWLPIGNDGTKFTGNYNGQDFTIKNLTINRPNEDNVGLFGHVGYDVDGVTIQNMHLINANVVGGRGTGSLVGRVTGNNNNLIDGCSTVGGSVRGDGATGGLVGSHNSYVTNPSNRNNHPILSKSFSNISVSWSQKAGSGADKLGGLTGCNQKGIIINCYARSSVSVDNVPAVSVSNSDGSLPSRIGGLSGCILIRGYIENSYATGAVITEGSVSNVGGFTGKGGTGSGDGETIASFWDTETSGQSSSSTTVGTTGKTTAEMQTLSTFVGWTFAAGSWSHSAFNNDAYPALTSLVTWSGSWDPASPAYNQNVHLATDYTGAGFICNNLTLAAGKKLTISSGVLKVRTNFRLKSDATEGTASFIDDGGSVSVDLKTYNELYLTGTGGASAQTGRGWYLSSPVVAASSAVVTNSALNAKLWKHTEAATTQSLRYSEITNLTPEILNQMEGYVVRAGLNGVITFEGGSPNTGEITLSNLSRTGTTDSKRGFHLVGNPYPSYLNWDAVVKTHLNTTIWYRACLEDGSTMTFDTYNATSQVGTGNGVNGTVTKFIPPMQAFWIRVDQDGTTGSIQVDNSMRSHQDSNPLRSVKARALLRIQVSNESLRDQTVIFFDEAASDDLDVYDAQKMNNNIAALPEIFCLVGNESIVINGLNNSSMNKEVQLGFKTGSANSFSIEATEISNFEEGTSIKLIDKLVGLEHELTEGAAYLFESEIITTTDRFSLVFAQTQTALETALTLSASVYRTLDNRIAVNIPNLEKKSALISVYNMLGQQLLSVPAKVEHCVLDQEFSSGVYLVTVQIEGKRFLQKVIMK